MNTDNTTYNPSAGWQNLGELKLPAGMNTYDAIHSWLVKILTPLNLSMNFLDRILQSSQDSVVQALQPDSAMTIGYIHLSVFIPYEPVSEGKNWGYFHIAKIGNQVEDIATHDHEVNFYLYVEGE